MFLTIYINYPQRAALSGGREDAAFGMQPSERPLERRTFGGDSIFVLSPPNGKAYRLPGLLAIRCSRLLGGLCQRYNAPCVTSVSRPQKVI